MEPTKVVGNVRPLKGWRLAFLMGEGWHNHHYYPGSARQSFYWWEFDPTYYLLKVLSWIDLVRDLRPVPERVYDRAVSGP